jgi:hypothetical protein
VDGREQEHHTFDLRRLGSMAAYHRLLLTKHGNMARIDIDGVLVADQMSMLSGAGYAALVTRGAAASFDGVTLSFLPAPG